MKKILFGSMLLIAGAAFALNSENNNSKAFSQNQFSNIRDTVPQDTSDTTDKPDSLFLANFLAKN